VGVNSLSHAIRRAIDAFAAPAVWAQLQANGMRADFSWGQSGRRYADLYLSLGSRS
jgi:starch synthase